MAIDKKAQQVSLCLFQAYHSPSPTHADTATPFCVSRLALSGGVFQIVVVIRNSPQ